MRKIAEIVADLKRKDERTIFGLYCFVQIRSNLVCDPVMGDNGRYYVPQELLPVYKEMIIPLADVLTPNAFELGYVNFFFPLNYCRELTNSKINTVDEAVKGMDAMHERGVRTVVVTSGVEGAQSGETLVCFASTYG